MQALRPSHLAGFIAYQVLADFDNSMGQTTHCAMLPHGVTLEIPAIGFVVPYNQIILCVQLIEKRLRQSRITVPQDAGMSGPRDAFPALR